MGLLLNIYACLVAYSERELMCSLHCLKAYLNGAREDLIAW